MFGRGNRGLVRTLCASVLAIALLLGSLAMSHAQDASDETDISISVRPSNATPVPTSVSPGVTPTPAPGVPGTVSARIVLVQVNLASGDTDDAIASIVIRDDRGTAAGWNVALSSSSLSGVDWKPELLENKELTIRRILPGDGRISDQVQGINGGRTLGPLNPAIPLLNAEPGSGSGLFMQQLVVVIPGMASPTLLGTIFVQLPFAP